MDIVVKKNYHEMSKYAAQLIAELIKEKPDCVLGLPTGVTPIGTYKELIRLHNAGLDFSKVTTFNLDEYLGVGIDLSKSYKIDQSFARFMHEELFSHINIKRENTHIPDGLATDPGEVCKSYEEAIKDAGGIDLQLLGIGGDGHWAFNEPGSSLTSRTRVEALTKRTLDDNYEAFYKHAGISREKMPHYAITMGVGTILEARKIVVIANGIGKSVIVSRALECPVSIEVPCSAIQVYAGHTVVILDKEAASKLDNTECHLYK